MNNYAHNGGNFWLTTNTDVQVTIGFKRIVHGGRGDYVEISNNQIIKNALHIPVDQRWRIDSNRAYYIEYRTDDNVKFYLQKKEVDYADYKIGMWYVSPRDLQEFIIVGKR